MAQPTKTTGNSSQNVRGITRGLGSHGGWKTLYGLSRRGVAEDGKEDGRSYMGFLEEVWWRMEELTWAFGRDFVEDGRP